MKQIFETIRLNVREFSEKDASFVLKLLNTESWLRYIGDRNIKNIEDANHYIINGPLFHYLKFGFGAYVVELKETHEAIGMCSLLKRETLENIDIGYAFLPEFWHKGYANECSKALINYAAQKLEIKKLVAITNPSNEASLKLLTKLHFTFEKIIETKTEEENLLLYSLNLKQLT